MDIKDQQVNKKVESTNPTAARPASGTEVQRGANANVQSGSGRPEAKFVIDPSKYKRRLADDIDRRFASIFTVTLIIHTIFFYYLSQIPYEMSIDAMRQFQEHYANFIYEEKPEPEPPAVQSLDEDKEKNKAKEEDTGEEAAKTKDVADNTPADTPPPPKVDARERREANTRSTEDIAQEASSKGLLALLSGVGDAAQGEGVVDLLGDDESGSSSNLDEVFSGIDGIKSRGTESDVKDTNSRGSRVTDGGGGIGVAALTAAKSSNFGKKSGELVTSNSALEAIQGKTGGRDPENVMKIVNSHSAAIEYCYQRALRRDPDLRGKVSVRFIITPSGSVSTVKLLESSFGNPSIERCITAKIKTWRDFGAVDPTKGDAVFRQDYVFGY